MPKLCSFGCSPQGSAVQMHTFPNPDKFPERFKIWVNLVGGKLESPSDYDFFKKKVVCDRHFIDSHKNRFRRLNILAIPSVNLPGGLNTEPQLPVAVSIAAEFPVQGHDQVLASCMHDMQSNEAPITRHSDVRMEYNYSAASRTRISPLNSDKVDPVPEHNYSRKRHFDHNYCQQEPPRDGTVPGPRGTFKKTRMDIESDVNIPYPGILELCGGGSPQTTKELVLGDEKVAITNTFTDDIEDCKDNTCVDEFDDESKKETYSCMETSSCDVIMCVGCLSVDRKCAPVGDNLELLIKLLCLSKDDEAPATTALLCWECAASLTRARRFVQRARRAQGELRRYASHPNGFVLEPQSNLTRVTKTDFDVTIVEAELPQMDDERDDGTKDDDENEAIADDISEMTDAKLEMDPRSMVQEIKSLPCSYSHHMRVIPAEGRSRGGGRGGGGSGGGQGALACAPCDVAFTTPAELNKHRAQEHPDMDEAPYVCSLCKDNFTKDELNSHMQQHMFVFYCEVCRRDFLTEKRFRVHYARGHAQIFECGYCRVPFATKALLARHCLSLHYKYCCAHCGRQYMARDQLERHMRSHR